MISNTWKQFERDAAQVFDAPRYPANQGGKVDNEGDRFVVQCKFLKKLGHEQLSALAEQIMLEGVRRGKDNQPKLGVVYHGVPPGRGGLRPRLVTMTEEVFLKLKGLWT